MNFTDATMFIVSAPSGAGKTSLVTRLLQEMPQVTCSVSHTTLEHANVFGNYYGTSTAAVKACIDVGKDVILEIDWQGGAQVKASHPDVVWIFILPPSRDALLQRLRGRASDTEEVIERRTSEAVTEMRECKRADFLIINDDFDQAFSELKAIITCHRLARGRQFKRNGPLLDSLMA